MKGTNRLSSLTLVLIVVGLIVVLGAALSSWHSASPSLMVQSRADTLANSNISTSITSPSPGLNLKGDGLDENLHASAETKEKVESGLSSIDMEHALPLMAQTSVMFALIGRDVEGELPYVLKNIEGLSKRFKRSHVVRDIYINLSPQRRGPHSRTSLSYLIPQMSALQSSCFHPPAASVVRHKC
jgi:hypothetical protein